MKFDQYEEATRCLAGIMLIAIERGMQSPYFEHFFENNLHAVPDMLSRLGVMIEQGSSHKFRVEWDPAMPLPMLRHPGEPSLKELGLGLDFCLVWYGGMVHLHESQKFGWIRNSLVQAAVSLGRGLLIDGVYVPEDERGEDMIEDYWHSRKELADRLGGESYLYPKSTDQ
jgi:hypothetical protein